jgi:hypothetical protein
VNNIEYGNKFIRLGKLIKSDKTKLKDLVDVSLECGLIYIFRLIPQPEGSIELNLNKQDVPYTVQVATRLARLAVEMDDIAEILSTLGADEKAEQLHGAAVMATDWSKAIQTEMKDCV